MSGIGSSPPAGVSEGDPSFKFSMSRESLADWAFFMSDFTSMALSVRMILFTSSQPELRKSDQSRGFSTAPAEQEQRLFVGNASEELSCSFDVAGHVSSSFVVASHGGEQIGGRDGRRIEHGGWDGRRIEHHSRDGRRTDRGGKSGV